MILLVGLGLAVAASTGGDDGPEPLPVPTTRPAPATAPCVPLPYQPCGEDAAPNTDGQACLEGFDDYDDDAATGCEAEADPLPTGAELDGELTANLVPADDVDTYRLVVEDRFQFDCGGAVHVTLTSPDGVSQRLRVLDGDDELGTTVSGDGEPATVTIRDPNCGRDDSTTLTVTVESVGSDRSAEDYLLEARGSF